jgi:hypothetical protein
VLGAMRTYLRPCSIWIEERLLHERGEQLQKLCENMPQQNSISSSIIFKIVNMLGGLSFLCRGGPKRRPVLSWQHETLCCWAGSATHAQ